jgi:hypothetical protein
LAVNAYGPRFEKLAGAGPAQSLDAARQKDIEPDPLFFLAYGESRSRHRND